MVQLIKFKFNKSVVEPCIFFGEKKTTKPPTKSIEISSLNIFLKWF